MGNLGVDDIDTEEVEIYEKEREKLFQATYHELALRLSRRLSSCSSGVKTHGTSHRINAATVPVLASVIMKVRISRLCICLSIRS